MPTHAQKIESSIAAYLANLPGDPWPDSLFNAEGAARIFKGESEELKDGQSILCIMDDMQEEFPEKSGNRYNLCRVEVRTPVRENDSPDQTDPLEDHAAAAEVLEDALTADDLVDQLTAAIPNFTAQGITDRQPIEEENDNYWMNGFTFRLYSCPRSFP